MKIALERAQVQALAQAFPRLSGLQDQLRYTHRLELPWQQLHLAELDFLGNLYEAEGAVGRHRQLAGLLAAFAGMFVGTLAPQWLKNRKDHKLHVTGLADEASA